MHAVDTFHPTMKEAMSEAANRRSDATSKDILVRIEKSPYGGYRVRSTPSDLYVDQITDGPFLFDSGNTRHMINA